MRRALVLALVALAVVGCARARDDLEELGLVDASSEPPPGILNPVRAGDLGAVSERGRHIARMDRALRLAYEEGATRIGVAIPDTALPLVDVDPGGASAQVLFVHWPRAANVLDADAAERWLLVAVLFDPDRVLDVELVTGKVEGWERQRVQTILVAAKGAAHAAPGGLFHLLDVTEREDAANERSPLQARVYALSADGDGPDLELLLGGRLGKRRELEVRSTTTVHPPGRGVTDPIVTELSTPAPTSVARVLLRGPDAGEVMVEGTDDARWSISARTAKITRQTTKGHAEDPATVAPDPLP
jgi:hypothetical protein